MKPSYIPSSDPIISGTTNVIIGQTRTCPDCGRPQHYTGLEYGWAHDALVDTWHCNDPRKDGA